METQSKDAWDEIVRKEQEIKKSFEEIRRFRVTKEDTFLIEFPKNGFWTADKEDECRSLLLQEQIEIEKVNSLQGELNRLYDNFFSISANLRARHYLSTKTRTIAAFTSASSSSPSPAPAPSPAQASLFPTAPSPSSTQPRSSSPLPIPTNTTLGSSSSSGSPASWTPNITPNISSDRIPKPSNSPPKNSVSPIINITEFSSSLSPPKDPTPSPSLAPILTFSTSPSISLPMDSPREEVKNRSARSRSTAEPPKQQVVPVPSSSHEAPEMGYSMVTYDIDYEEIGSSTELTKNSYGVSVLKARLRGMDACAKSLNLEQQILLMKEHNSDLYPIKNETTYQLFHTHENLANVIGFCSNTSENRLIFVREYFVNGSLADMQNIPNTKLSFWRKIHILSQIASAMNFVLSNSQFFTNPNLSRTNILFNNLWDVKLADQGYFSVKSALTGGKEKLRTESELIKEFGTLTWELINESKSELTIQVLESNTLNLPPALKGLLKDCLLSKITFSQLCSPQIFDDIISQTANSSTSSLQTLWAHIQINGRTWHQFLNHFRIQANLPAEATENTLEIQCLKALLGCNDCSTITDESWSRFVNCIGPFLNPAEAVDHITALLSAQWFVGSVSPGDAEKMLKNLKQLRTFLVRFSARSGDLSVTWKVKDKVMHTRVPPGDKYNIYGYVDRELRKKKFEEVPLSPYIALFQKRLPKYNKFQFML